MDIVKELAMTQALQTNQILNANPMLQAQIESAINADERKFTVTIPVMDQLPLESSSAASTTHDPSSFEPAKTKSTLESARSEHPRLELSKLDSSTSTLDSSREYSKFEYSKSELSQDDFSKDELSKDKLSKDELLALSSNYTIVSTQDQQEQANINEWLDLIAKLQTYEVAFALYRLPRQKEFHLVLNHSSLCFTDWSQLSGHQGFVFAPFDLESGHPIVMIEPLVHTVGLENSSKAIASFIAEHHLSPCTTTSLPQWAKVTLEQQKSSYKQSFEQLQQALHQGECSKLVLSRAAAYQCTPPVNLGACFLKACQLYPNLMVSLTHTAQTGTWLGATPEVLLSGYHDLKSNDGQWHTMSLAGTMHLDQPTLPTLEQWSDKNRHEQAIVTQFLATTLIPWCKELHFTGPYTAQAGNLVHLKTDVTFKLQKNADLPQVLKQLHPTPAVCGMPKHKAYELIRQLESYERSYYAGALGLFGVSEQFTQDHGVSHKLTQACTQTEDQATGHLTSQTAVQAIEQVAVQATSQETKQALAQKQEPIAAQDQAISQATKPATSNSAEQASVQVQTNTFTQAATLNESALANETASSNEIASSNETTTSNESKVATQLFVNLRCMQFYSTHSAICYAGGGILTESEEVSEFQETQRKMETMRNLLEPPFKL